MLWVLELFLKLREFVILKNKKRTKAMLMLEKQVSETVNVTSLQYYNY
jgi:hypothetical protein